ncbi:hypothetical protein AaE_007997 [Aphanomyces astaci]|uniref:DDE-1 domain-containing protein n=1 Tax=Aphanomyces astaci TaxID=112090 RepID=A0A6A5AEK3_APHAT|nr:hypothetical protein AaE_007997 [Aphanomyces astaci]
MLYASIPSTTKRPILLILDGCSSHYSTYIYNEAGFLSILLLFLPANSTHLFQPLDVTVYRPFKQAVQAEVANVQWADFRSSINKQQAISIACDQGVVHYKWIHWIMPSIVGQHAVYAVDVKQSEDQEVEIDDTWLKRTATIRNDLLFLLPEENVLWGKLDG